MNAGGDEQRVEPLAGGAGDIGAHRVADRQHPRTRERRFSRRARRGQRGAIDRRVRLARIDRLAAERLVGLGQRAGAIDQSAPR